MWMEGEEGVEAEEEEEVEVLVHPEAAAAGAAQALVGRLPDPEDLPMEERKKKELSQS